MKRITATLSLLATLGTMALPGTALAGNKFSPTKPTAAVLEAPYRSGHMTRVLFRGHHLYRIMLSTWS